MSKLDEILAPYEFYPDHPFKQEIKDLLLELIGEDEEPGRTMGPGMPGFQRDGLRRDLRKKVENL